MYKNIKSSLIISTYNWPAALELTLSSIKNQSVYPDEVIVADDGSGPDTKKLVEDFSKQFPCELIHVWHEDKGFRLAEIRNKAIVRSSGDYIIQVDGDIILHRHFIKDHLRFARPNSFVRASRSYLDREISERLLKEKMVDLHFYSPRLDNRLSALHIPILWGLFEKRYKANQPYEIHGCNMAFWKSAAVVTNGYNENFTGWGPEDKEFVVRLLNNGFEKRFIKLGGIAFHLWHPENTKPNLQNNETEFFTAINEKRKYCVNGLNKHLSNGES